MCQAFKFEHQVTLLARNAPGDPRCVSEIYEYYGISRPFNIIFPWGVRFKLLGSIAGYVFLFKMLVLKKPELCFGRHLKSVVLAGRMGFPIIYEAHEVPKSQAEKILIRNIYSSRHFAGMVFISSMLQENYLNIFPDLPLNKVMVAHDGIDLEHVSRISPETLSNIAGRPDAFKVGYVGGLKPEKGIGLILSIAGMMPGMEFHLVGGNNDELNFWRKQAESMSNVFFYGQVSPESAIKYQKAFNVLLAPYEQASWDKRKGHLETVRDKNRIIGNSPLKFFEYMACAKPILTSDIPISREIFIHEHDALLLDPENPEKWVNYLNTLHDNPELAQKLSANARQKAREYTWEKRAQKIITYFCR